VDWLDTLLRLQGLKTTAAHRNLLAQALALLGTEEPQHRTLDALAYQVPDQEMQTALRPYRAGGPLGNLLSGSTDPLAASHYLCFELGHILETDPRALVPVQLYLAHTLGKRRTAARPTLLLWDEAWRALEDPTCRAWIKNDLATARKQNCGVVLITQSLAQVAEPDLRTLIDEAAQIKVFLPNPAATKPSTRKLYEALGLSDRLSELVATMVPKRDYLYSSRYAHRIFQLGETELARVLLTPPPGTTEEALVGEVRALVARHPDDWLEIYLGQRGAQGSAESLVELRSRFPALDSNPLSLSTLEAP
jgi:type IV secretion system protein VirB4